MAMNNPLNKIIMQEVGLTIDSSKRVIDEETREPIIIKDKQMKYSSQNCIPIRRNEQAFDPSSNKGQMNAVFEYFVGKVGAEGVFIDMYYDVDDGAALEAKVGNKTITTNSYNNEQLKYVDMMRQLNNSSADDIKSFDIKKKPTRPSRRAKLDFNR